LYVDAGVGSEVVVYQGLEGVCLVAPRAEPDGYVLLAVDAFEVADAVVVDYKGVKEVEDFVEYTGENAVSQARHVLAG
jgi:hypothetical protein